MKILRVKVPYFRNLRDVDISFEQDLRPPVFPIGSQNGGGKSTLLQLLFALLHCPSNRERLPYLRNTLLYFSTSAFEAPLEVATIEIMWEEMHLRLAYSLRVSQVELGMGRIDEPEEEGVEQRSVREMVLLDAFPNQREVHLFCRLFRVDGDLPVEYENNPGRLLFLLAEKVFLAGPATQPYVFLGDANRSLLMDETEKGFDSHLQKARNTMPNLYLYTHSAVSAILRAFRAAREDDFSHVVETLEYTNHFQQLVRELGEVLGPLGTKLITPDSSLESLRVRQQGATLLELRPEDLSHGELKRLGLYAWIKLQPIVDSVVLLDEIENGFHPDWQLNIVNELSEWGQNQYILATHSFDLCQALTPRHVKEVGLSLAQKRTP